MDPTGLTWGLVVPDTLRRRVIAKTLGATTGAEDGVIL